MKRFFFVLMLLLPCSALLLRAQQSSAPTTLEGWAERLETFGKSIPQEQVFVHMDNTCYFLGDTIYYKAYVRRSDTGAPSRLSGVLYAELLNQDGYLVAFEYEFADGDFVSFMRFTGFADSHGAGVPVNPNDRLFIQGVTFRQGVAFGKVLFHLFNNQVCNVNHQIALSFRFHFSGSFGKGTRRCGG